MAYLSWSHSYWHAYKTVGTGPGDDTVLTLHSGNGSLWLRAAELRSCGATGDVQALREFVQSRLAASSPRAGDTVRPSSQDWVDLRRAVDDFLRAAYRGGELPIPSEVLRRYRICQRLIQRWIRRGCRAPDLQDPLDERAKRQFVNLCGWWRYTKQVLIDYPPPPVPKAIQELEFKRSQRVLLGESVSPEQDAQERALIRAARAWPPLDEASIRQRAGLTHEQ